MDVAIQVPAARIEKLERPLFFRRVNRFWNSFRLNLTRNRGFYFLVTNFMCLLLVMVKYEVDRYDWNPQVISILATYSYPQLFPVSALL